MKFGIAYPNLINGDEIRRFAIHTEALGFESIWAGDHIVLPSAGTKDYPYTRDGTFQRPSHVPFIEPMTLLTYIAGVTERIKIGTTVIIVPYRHPVVQAKMFANLDVLTNGRVICGVGVGWLRKEFEILGAPFEERGPMTDEYIEIFKCLWTEELPNYQGRFHQIDGITFEPKPIQSDVPIWVGGHSKRAIRRTVHYGHAWHPTRQSPEYVESMLPYLRAYAEERGRDPASITVSLKRGLHFTDLDMTEGGNPNADGTLVGTTDDVIRDVEHCQSIGIDQVTFDFRTSNVDDCCRVLDNLAEKVKSRF
ncbi:MAG: LLM class F420-dependent oxidoreductase [Chromatiales bacterium]|jgi:probable F420-dependent oxidoreductase|nr:LLM class F420-dependent oxidoreductase [Chromatiales bacterium]